MNTYNTYKGAIDDSINISYKGNITFEFVDCVLEILLNRLESGEEDVKTRMRVFSILTECLQNLCSYVEKGQEKPNKEDSVFFLLTTLEDHYQIVTGNFVRTNKVNSMKERLSYLKSCSKEDLKKEYNTVLKNDKFGEKGGAGLGFIEIAKKTNQKFDFDFVNIDQELSFFELIIQITRNQR